MQLYGIQSAVFHNVTGIYAGLLFEIGTKVVKNSTVNCSA
jgi:hypothetical protein